MVTGKLLRSLVAPKGADGNVYVCVCVYVYISTWLRPSRPPLIKGWFDHMEANYWSFASPPPHKPPKIIKMVAKRTPIQEQFTTNQSWGVSWGLLGELQGPKSSQNTQKKSQKCEVADPPAPQFEDFSVIFISFGC